MLGRRGFTLLELMIVIIIIGVLATVGIMQYQASIEKSRGMEARSVAGNLRSICAAQFLANSNTSACDAASLKIGTDADDIPSACTNTNYFSYGIASTVPNAITITATRCTANGKTPQGKVAGTLTLTTNYVTGSDVWAGTGGY